MRSDGSVSYVRIRFVADCRKKDRVYTDGIFYRDRAPALFTRDGANFSDGGTFKRKLGRDTTTISTRMTGAPSADGGFEGTFRASIRIYNSKKRLRDVCRVSGVTWKVPPAA